MRQRAYLFRGAAGLVEIARGADDMGAMRRQRARRLHAETGGDARHQHALPRKIDTFETSSVVDSAPNDFVMIALLLC